MMIGAGCRRRFERGKRLEVPALGDGDHEAIREFNERARGYGLGNCLVDGPHIREIEPIQQQRTA